MASDLHQTFQPPASRLSDQPTASPRPAPIITRAINAVDGSGVVTGGMITSSGGVMVPGEGLTVDGSRRSAR